MTESSVGACAIDSWELPPHTIAEMMPRRHPYCVCVFVLNEGTRIIRQVRKMRPWSEIIDIIVADGGSTDGALRPSLLEEVKARTLLVKSGSGQLGAQMRMAFAYALRQGYNGVVTIDGNDKDDVTALPLFVQALAGGFDYIQGSRFVHGGVAVNTPLTRLLAIKLIHAPLIRRACGFPYTDTTNGFRAYSGRFLLDDRVRPFRSAFQGYELQYYLAIRAATLGFRVMEVPVTRRYPAKGPIPTKIRGLRGTLLVLDALARACLYRFDPEP